MPYHKKGRCILCRRDGREMSDEHVIPDAIGGYYHIYSVCKECNSRLGSKVDKYLLDNWLTVVKRNEHQMAGKTGVVPHPLMGEGVLEDGQKVRMEKDEEGHLFPYLIPSAPIVSDDGKQVSFSLDARDAKSVNHITEKVLKRKGFDRTRTAIESFRQDIHIDKPCVRMQFSIDIKSYLLSLLKIAYEFTIDQLPSYIEDPQARLYADILLCGEKDRVDEISVMANGFMDKKFVILPTYIDNNEHRHLLFLTEVENQLVCVVKLFDVYGVSIRMSDKSYGVGQENGIIAINDFGTRTCDIYTLEEVIQKVIGKTRREFIFDEAGDALINRVINENNYETVGFACNGDGYNLIFNEFGVPIGTEEQYLLFQDKKSLDHTTMTDEGIVSTYDYPDGYYYCLKPINQLVKIKGLKELITLNKL